MSTQIGPYQLGDSFDSLPFGELATATHAARSEPLAVLLLDDRLAKDHRFRGLLRLEVARAGGVRHPAIARTVEVGEHDGRLYVVYERPADCQTLGQALSKGDPPFREEAIALVKRLAEGLDLIHGRRLLHGALGPSSVLVGPDGSAVVVGIALLGAIQEAGLAEVVAERSEAAFAAPEQRDGRRAVASADGFALAALAASLLHVPLPSAGPADPVGNVLARQSSTDPGARYPNCTAFVAALADAIAPTSTPVPASTSAPAPTPPMLAVTAEPAALPSAHRLRDTEELPGLPPPAQQADDTLALRLPPAAEDEHHRADQEPVTLETVGAQPQASGAVDPAAAHPNTDTSRLTVGDPQFRPRAAPAGEVVVTTGDLTPAMSEMLNAPEQRDLIGDGIQWLAARNPALDELLDRYCPDGKYRGVPLGIAAAGALSGLMAVAGQFLAATVIVMVVVVIYAMPLLGAALTKSERSSLRVTRVTGPARLQRREDAIGLGVCTLTLADERALSLRNAEFGPLSRFGWAATVQRPMPGTAGVRDEVAWYDLPGVTVTYLSPAGMLLDVRGPDDAVLFRRAPYAGEPGDRLLPPDLPAESGVQSSAPGQIPSTAERSAPQAGLSTTPVNLTRSSVTELPMPEAAHKAMEAAAQSALIKTAFALGSGLIGLVAVWFFFGSFGFFWVVFVVIALIGNAGTITQTLKLLGARKATTMTRVTGPATMTYHTRRKQSSLYRLTLMNGAVLRIDSALHTRLIPDADEMVTYDGWGLSPDRFTSEGYLRSEHRMSSVTVTYEPTASHLLEIVNPFGGALYRDSALHEGDLGPVQPRV